MPRFFVDAEQIRGGAAALTGQHLAHVKALRLRRGETVTLCDGMGTDYVCTVAEIGPERALLTVEQKGPALSEASIQASVYMAYAKGDKLEHVIQKATELGAQEILVFPSDRCVARPDAAAVRKKLPRWQKIAQSAAEQSGRGRIPQVLALESFAGAVSRAAAAEKALFFYENEQKQKLSGALAGGFSSVSLMTGPEGGFTPQEVAQAAQAGMEICTLGRRILRCETAPLCALAAVMFAAGEY